tara:strand:+ start:592 stop:1551 length:960 start_codon:yes stop_codon:yes gene_type:complete
MATEKTVAWSHKGGYWKTRYSFASYCYAFIDRIFLSFNTFFTNAPVWRHDDDTVTRTSFYGNVGGSAISVTFNENVSSNKIYKALSLESTNNVNGITALTINNSTVADQTKNITATVLEEKGGIMYGGVGFDNRLTGANVKAVGSVSNMIGAAGITTVFIDFIDGGNSYNLTVDSSTRYFFMNVGEDGVSTFFATDLATPIAVPDEFNTTFTPFTLVTEGEAEAIGVNYMNLAGGVAVMPTTGNTYLYSATPGETNGEGARGQTADAVITLGSNEYELFAVNLEYEETDYDHRDERFARRSQSGTQRNRQGRQRQRRRR